MRKVFIMIEHQLAEITIRLKNMEKITASCPDVNYVYLNKKNYSEQKWWDPMGSHPLFKFPRYIKFNYVSLLIH